MENWPTPQELVVQRQPSHPVICVRPQRIVKAARWYRNYFPGEIFYAMKANPNKWVLDHLYQEGIRGFDVASEQEIISIRTQFPDARLAFMNPVKSRNAIGLAYFDANCRIFALDHPAELEKIKQETNHANDLTLILRFSIENSTAEMPLSGKFGIPMHAAKDLLKAVRIQAKSCGITFHLGSQCMDPSAYYNTMIQASKTVSDAGIILDIVDVGGGFPSVYPGLYPPPLKLYSRFIERGISEMNIVQNAQIWCEPGRSLVAESVSVIVRVELRKDQNLYINDGAYGNLYDAAHYHWPYPVRLLRSEPSKKQANLKPFRFLGPTCDTADRIQNTFNLPEDIREGEYIEIGMLGAYGSVLATGFNGFGLAETVFVKDDLFIETAFDELETKNNNAFYSP